MKPSCTWIIWHSWKFGWRLWLARLKVGIGVRGLAYGMLDILRDGLYLIITTSFSNFTLAVTVQSRSLNSKLT